MVHLPAPHELVARLDLARHVSCQVSLRLPASHHRPHPLLELKAEELTARLLLAPPWPCVRVTRFHEDVYRRASAALLRELVVLVPFPKALRQAATRQLCFR